MTYVAAPSHAIPFPDGHFDVVSSFNSLDHVDDLDGTAREVVRVLAPGGLFLLLSEVNHEPTVCEPVAFSWDVVEKYRPALTPVDLRRYEKKAPGMYESIAQAVPYDDADPSPRYGILSAKFVKGG